MIKRLIALCLALLLMNSVALAEFDFAIRSGDPEKKQVAITIDDCRNMDLVRASFDLSQRYDVPFTYFILGIEMEQLEKEEDKEVWRAIVDSGSEIGNHTYGHYSLPTRTEKNIYTQLMRAQECLDAVLGYHYPMQVMRPPFGHLNRDGKTHVNRTIQAVGYDHAILWTIDETDPEKCYRQIENGSILLFHTNTKDIQCIETILPKLLEDGYELVTISEMIGKEPVVTSAEPYTYVNYADWQRQQQEASAQENP